MNNEKIQFFYCGGEKLLPRKNEALRYMGCANEPDSEEFALTYSKCLESYLLAADYKCAYRKTSVRLEGTDTVVFDFCTIKSESLYKNMSGCNSAFVFAATAGAKVDKDLNELPAADSFIMSCIASSGVEVWCDEVCRSLAKGHTLKPRFSPGYGGVNLQHQKDVFVFLDATKSLGITLNDSFIMTPSKSVTAFVGIVE